MGWTYHNSFFGNFIMPSKPPITEHANPEASPLEVLQKHYSRGGLATLISYANAVKGSRAEWAHTALHDIAKAAMAELLAYKDGSVEVTVDGINLRVRARKIPRHDEYQLWVAESSLAALDTLLIARREQYYTQHGLAHDYNHETTLHPDMASRVANQSPEAEQYQEHSNALRAARKTIIGESSPEAEAEKIRKWESMVAQYRTQEPIKPEPRKPKSRRDEPPPPVVVYERDIILEDLTKILEQKLKNPLNQRLGELHSISDFKLVIEDALKDIELPQSRNEHCHIGSYEMPFGLEQMQELRAEIRHRINTKPRASAGLGVLLQAIDETMEQFWNERPLGVRTQANAGHAK